MSHNSSHLIYIVAGEASGDLIGSQLISSIRQYSPKLLHFAGIGGQSMINQGFKSLLPMDSLSIIGITEVISHIPLVLNYLRLTINDIKELKPDVIVTIDSPGFNFRLAKQVKRLGIPLIHYTAPSVWAWRPNRAKKLARLYDHLLTLFAFEPQYFKPYGLKCNFVGHPLIEKNIDQIKPLGLIKQYNLTSCYPLICVLPGSRNTEVIKLLPIFMQSLIQLRNRFPNLQIIIPTLPRFKELIDKAVQNYAFKALVITEEQAKYQAMRASHLALTASGTATLELSLAQTPMIVGYKVNKLTEWLIKPLLSIDKVALPNIIMNQEIVKECLQSQCNSDQLTKEISNIIYSPQQSHEQRLKLSNIRNLLQNNNRLPSQLAAEIILSYCKN